MPNVISILDRTIPGTLKVVKHGIQLILRISTFLSHFDTRNTVNNSEDNLFYNFNFTAIILNIFVRSYLNEFIFICCMKVVLIII